MLNPPIIREQIKIWDGTEHTIIASGSIPYTMISTTSNWVTIDMIANSNIESNHLYVLWLDPEPQSYGKFPHEYNIWLRVNSNGGYSSGSGLSCSTDYWDEEPFDYLFEIYGNLVLDERL